MSKNTLLSNLINYISANSSGNVVVAAPSSGLALDVTGTGRFTGQLTLGSTITNGTFTYTLPSATGTLALTSALGSYLPLSGGTLTGALNGTSANFTGRVLAGNTMFLGEVISGFTTIESTSGNGIWLRPAGASDPTGLKITTTGAATFSSSVTARTSINLVHSNGTTVAKIEEFSGTQGVGLSLFNSSGTQNVLFNAGGDSFIRGGNVGIGTTAPTSPLHVGTGTSGNQKIQQWGEPGFVQDYGLILRGSSLDGVFKFYGLNNGTETTNPILSMNRSNGNVGIGTTSPTYSLDVYNTASQNARVRITGTSNFSLFQAQNSSGALFLGIDSSTQDGFSFGNYSRVLYSSDAYPLVIAVNNAERMRITSSGNVGIGTTSPAALLEINRSTNSGSGTTFPRINVVNSLATQGDGSNTFNFADIRLSAGNDAVQMFMTTTFAAGTWAPAGIINVATNHDLQFKTNNTERMRITSGGNLLVGSTTDSAALQRSVITNGASNSGFILQTGGTNRGYLYTSSNFIFLESTSASIYVSPAGANGVYITPGSTAWTANSDLRLKNVNSEITDALGKLNNLRAINYSWKSDSSNKENIGLIAQEVNEVLPQLIDTNKDGYLGVRYTELVPVLVQAIKELKAELDTLKNK